MQIKMKEYVIGCKNALKMRKKSKWSDNGCLIVASRHTIAYRQKIGF